MSKNTYALILGCSSGFGKSTALELAKNGYNIYGVHFDRGSMRKEAEEFREELETHGITAKFFNTNAASDDNRAQVIEEIKKHASEVEGHELRILIHSLAFGALKDLVAKDRDNMLSRKQIEMTMDVMANSLVYWVQDVYVEGLLANNSRIMGFTSIGSFKNMLGYGAVSAAKAALESYTRQLAIELAHTGTTCNSIFAGLTETPAASKIPGYDKMVHYGTISNPYKRLTSADDVAKVVRMLADPECNWINGDTIAVDGGDSIYEFVNWDAPRED